MPYRKKNQAAKELETLIQQNKLMYKMFRATTAKLSYGTREANDLDVGSGKVVLQDTTIAVTGTSRLPLIMYPLRSIINGGTIGKANFILDESGYNFNSTANIDFLGGANLDADPTIASRIKKMVHQDTRIKLLFWQNALKDVRFTVRLIRFNSKEMDPAYGATTTDPEVQDKRRQLFYFLMLRQQLSNPIVGGMEHHSRDIKADFEVLFKKDIHIQEQSVAHDEKHYEQIDIYKKYDHLVAFRESPTVNTDSITNGDNPDVIFYPSNTEVPTAYPDHRAQIYLMITANTTKSDRDDAVNFDKATFDIALKSNYVAPSQDLYNV